MGVGDRRRVGQQHVLSDERERPAGIPHRVEPLVV